MPPLHHDTLVDAQFGSRAAAYVTSAVHAQGEDLRNLAALVAGHAGARVLMLDTLAIEAVARRGER
jgi:hypothetical protein